MNNDNQVSDTQSADGLVLFEGPSFTINVPSGWLAIADQEFQASFIGPKIGERRANITIAMTRLDPTLSLDDVVASMRDNQAANLDGYTLRMEAELDSSELPAMLRHFHWFDPEVNMTILQRQLIILSTNYAYAVTATQPNNPQQETLDALFLQCLNSFRAGALNI